jgi:SAM-dependent methyltransferase
MSDAVATEPNHLSTNVTGMSAGARSVWDNAADTDMAAAEYIRRRINPRPGDPAYLHLSDLLLAITELIPPGPGRVLDFGCGGSPYRRLFGPCTYHRADLAGSGAGLDFEYGPDSLLPAPSEDYDCVLSSQVLEHVGSPRSYLDESRRVLKPGGCLILTTHGLFEDHFTPCDYWRWTVYGLRKLVEESGYNIERISKLTTGPRAAVFMAEREQGRLTFNRARLWSRVGFYSRMLNCGAALFRRAGAWRIHNACDANLPQHRVVDPDQPGHDIYVAIALIARR